MGIPKSMIDAFPPHIQKQIRSQFAEKTRMEELAGEENPEKKSKYSSAKTDIDGIRFDSKKEAEFYAELKLREKVGEISHLRLQPRYLLQEAFKHEGKQYREIEYVADFEYIENGVTVVVDVKGFRTAIYMLKKKLFLYKYGDNVRFIEE
jgi:gp72 family protein